MASRINKPAPIEVLPEMLSDFNAVELVGDFHRYIIPANFLVEPDYIIGVLTDNLAAMRLPYLTDIPDAKMLERFRCLQITMYQFTEINGIEPCFAYYYDFLKTDNTILIVYHTGEGAGTKEAVVLSPVRNRRLKEAHFYRA